MAVLASPTSTLSVEKPTAVFIETHGEEQSSLFDYWHAAVSFRQIGFSAHLLSPYIGVTRVYPENLTDFVSVLIITPRSGASFELDIDMFADYVAAGGGLILAGQYATSQFQPWARTSVNKLTSSFGIEFEADLVCDPRSPYLVDQRYPHWPMITEFADHAATEGVRLVSYHSGCSLRISGNATAIAWTSEAAWSDVDGDMQKSDEEIVGRKVVAAVSTYGKGRVACVGDNDLWSSRYLNGFDNNRLLLNLVKWVSRDIEEPDLQLVELDIRPEAVLGDDGNYTALIPIRIWNQGTAPVQNVTIYVGQGKPKMVGDNLTFSQLDAGQKLEAEVLLSFAGTGSQTTSLRYEYFTAGGKEYGTLRTLTLEADFDIYHIPSLLTEKTEIAIPSPGGAHNFTQDEVDAWVSMIRALFPEADQTGEANQTEEVNQTAETSRPPVFYNHTDIASKSGNYYSIKSGHYDHDLIGLGDLESNYVVGYVLQYGLLQAATEGVPIKVKASDLLGGSLEEMVTGMPRLEGNISDWGYISLVSREKFGDRGDTVIAVGGFGRSGIGTALELFAMIIRGEAAEYEDKLSGKVALFRGIYQDGNLTQVEFR